MEAWGHRSTPCPTQRDNSDTKQAEVILESEVLQLSDRSVAYFPLQLSTVKPQVMPVDTIVKEGRDALPQKGRQQWGLLAVCSIGGLKDQTIPMWVIPHATDFVTALLQGERQNQAFLSGNDYLAARSAAPMRPTCGFSTTWTGTFSSSSLIRPLFRNAWIK